MYILFTEDGPNFKQHNTRIIYISTQDPEIVQPHEMDRSQAIIKYNNNSVSNFSTTNIGTEK